MSTTRIVDYLKDEVESLLEDDLRCICNRNLILESAGMATEISCETDNCSFPEVLRNVGVETFALPDRNEMISTIVEAAEMICKDAIEIKPGMFFEKTTGIQVTTLAEYVTALGPIALGTDDIMWSYNGGVWRPDRHVVRNRVVDLLGERYRYSYARGAEDVIRSQVQRISAEPVTEYINFGNGLLDWETKELRPHTPEVMSTVQLAVPWDPQSKCPQFDKFLSEVVPEDMIETVWELVGYLMFSGNPLHKAVMLVGTGRNGKGTFLRVMSSLLGKWNTTAVSLQDIVNTRFSTASLFGKLANIAGDIDGGYLESTATFKAVTGQDQISAEHKGRDRFDFTPWAVPVFSANSIPASADATIGYLSRWLVVPFPNDFTGREDRHLDARLHTPDELAGIAARAVPALRRLLDRGDFDLPDSGKAAYEEFTRRVDQVRTWLNDQCEIGGDSFVSRVGLYRAYREWATRDGYRPLKAAAFYDRINAAGHQPIKVQGIRGYRGITVGHVPGSFSSGDCVWITQ